MSEIFARLVEAVSRVDPVADATSVAEAVWLAAHRTSAPAIGDRPSGTEPPGPAHADAATGEATLAESSPPGSFLYDLPPGGAVAGPARRVGITRPSALPRSLELMRGLRPFKREWPSGRHLQLDLASTVHQYTETGRLIPVFRPAPERWFEVVLVVDDSPGMAAWTDTFHEFERVLQRLGAFRALRVLHLDPAAPTSRDDANRLHAPAARRLIIMFTDCSDAIWQTSTPWAAIRSWARSTPTVLVNPLPAALWDHAGPDLPTVRVRAVGPGRRNASLSYRLPSLLPDGARSGACLPIPVAALTRHSLASLAATLMRADPDGCAAVLTAPGIAAQRFRSDPDAAGLVTSFRRSATPAAVRLATLAATWERLTLPMLRLIAERAIPSAGAEEAGEVIAGGLFTIDRESEVLLTFRPEVRDHLRDNLRVDDVWQMRELMADQLARTAADEFPVALPDPVGAVKVPAGSPPFAVASREALDALGATRLPEPAGDRPHRNPFAETDGRPLTPWQREVDLDFYVDVDGSGPAFAEFTSRSSADEVLRNGQLVIVAGPGGSGKSSLANRCAYWLERQAADSRITAKVIDARATASEHEPVDQRVVHVVEFLISEVTRSRILRTDLLSDRDHNSAALLRALSQALVGATAMVIVLLPPTELLIELQRYATLTHPGIQFIAEARFDVGPDARTALREGRDPLILTLGTLERSDAEAFVNNRMSRFDASTLPRLEAETIDRMIDARPMTIREFQRLLAGLYDELVRSEAPKPNVTFSDVAEFYFRVSQPPE